MLPGEAGVGPVVSKIVGAGVGGPSEVASVGGIRARSGSGKELRAVSSTRDLTRHFYRVLAPRPKIPVTGTVLSRLPWGNLGVVH